jgi:CRISPR-associated protein Cas2
MNRQWYLVSYDIRNPERLRRVARHMEGYGERIQFSVFRCRLSPRQLERLRWELAGLTAEEDDLLVVGLCRNCVGRLRHELRTDWPDIPESWEIV